MSLSRLSRAARAAVKRMTQAVTRRVVRPNNLENVRAPAEIARQLKIVPKRVTRNLRVGGNIASTAHRTFP